MAQFLTTRGTTSEIEKIINEAKNVLVLISPYIDIPDSLLQNLNSADKRGVNINLIYGKNKSQDKFKAQLEQFRHLTLKYLDNLHAKCYYNENKMIITSLNLVDFSEQNNREMGILLEKSPDSTIWGKAIEEATVIIESSEMIPLINHVHVHAHEGIMEDRQPYNVKIGGYCIRCGKDIPLNTQAPYCSKCFSIWVTYKDETFEEKHCHQCGKDAITSMKKPLCGKCYKQVNR